MPAQNPSPGVSRPDPTANQGGDRAILLCGALLAAGVLAAYSRTFTVPLLFDDNGSIADNPSIRRLWPLWSALSPPSDAGVAGRPLLNLTFALNYAAGGASVAGYHLVNLLIHVAASWTLFALVRRTLLRPVMAARFGPAAAPLALAAAAIWALHPVLTEAVTYLCQRAESLMGLFYLLTLYCFLRGAEGEDKGGGRAWFALSVLACLAGVGTKEIIVTAPATVLLYDRTFISGSFSGAWRRHWPQLLALAATWIPLGWLMIGLRDRGAGFGLGVGWQEYGLVECRAVVKYLLLTVWPHPLVFDHGSFVPSGWSEVWPYVLALAALLAATGVALRRSPPAGFAACWFFLILAPSSSVIPLVTQPMAESRVYLSLAGVAALGVMGGFALAGRRALPVFAVAAVALGLETFQRNQAYASELAIWSDSVAKLPANSRAHNNLGFVLDAGGRTREAIAHYEESLRLNPSFAEAHYNLGNAWLKDPGRLNDAIAQFREALRLEPGLAEAHNSLGNVLVGLPDGLGEAVAEYEAAIRLKPGYAEAHNNLGMALAKTPGGMGRAMQEFETALRLKPEFADAHVNLGNALSDIPGRLPEAIAEFESAIRSNPDSVEAHFNLGNALLRIGHQADALAEYREVLRIRPGFGPAEAMVRRLGSAGP
jgi:tetratricopeptide (TPR) repeat protein